MNNPQQNNLPEQNNDEIDLFELVATLWRGKWLIAGVTFVCTVVAIIFAFIIIKPVYQATAIITQPTVSQIAPINLGLLYQARSTEVSIAINNNNNNNNNNNSDYYNQDLYPQPITNKMAFATFLDALQTSNAILKQDKNNQNRYTLSQQNFSAEQALADLKSQLNESNIHAISILSAQQNGERIIIMDNIINTLSTLRNRMDKAQKIKIQQLNNALTIAEKLNITQPILPISEPYMQGTEALTAQIQLLESDKAFYTNDPQYNELSSMLEYYQSIQNHQLPELMTFNLLQKPTVSLEPIKPNKKLITIIGFLLGGMLGCMIVLIRQAVRNRLSTFQK
ncbi:LPS O-antigen chain length determinant protein WzzB [Wohlfahrtiimonas chitiniclastica]|uniref:Wzz/FepE/Etk N-terminal domain-containing protein n=1 Tax=Wohlfahrtiimonas chitiniclastica TaxID=400946 RepID=UPI001BCD83FD|nr:Wzz/FepE/Etk N-terminal domain-containing protein [Wohlfahrtiimonas chitiniclastica]MBS7834590.1 LPS O-antigen chain length determinant protein WzzB [Wohlfahrtiimonas chitiniclastica]